MTETRIEIATQADLDKFLATHPNGDVAGYLVSDEWFRVDAGRPWLVAWGSSQPHVVARESSQPHVVARESSQPHVVARESSQPHVVAWGSSQPHVVAWESSQPHVEAWGSSQPHVVAWGSSQPHVVARGSSQPHVVARESSQPHVVAWGSSQPHVVAWGSSQPHVEAWGSSQPHVVAWGSSQPHVVARESSQPHVVAWESSQPHVVATGYAQLSLAGAVIVTAGPTNAVLARGTGAKITGGNIIRYDVATPEEWCEYYGVAVVGGVATLYKAIQDDYRSTHGISYAPGSSPVAPDWDGGKAECGGGLHFSPHPVMALEFCPDAKRYVACPVALEDMRPPHDDDSYPQKIKAKRVCGPVVEVDRYGKPIGEKTVSVG
jgi:hypothetical protein